ncbi:hypothetical protein BO78DRAFT_421475 [Aspergillus sclerotiicarbonarius CBS 121057]|uniref:Uncharacterized protein n=1 Tax=Aspergillus sclerotiicarbonarius (strain CBS 121057 / IBT 28362) TaxID=1448318 RepID=A0A319E0H1_ASPSB|nr:hypothetical protein BO78DRAFT_421475 [Aspergillus sclerotiicarbonarius CBS 121057]
MPFQAKLAKIAQYLLPSLEERLERRGNWKQAQRLRIYQVAWRDLLEIEQPSHPVAQYIQIGFKLRFCIQREAYLQAKHNLLYEPTKTASARCRKPSGIWGKNPIIAWVQCLMDF